VIDLMGDLLTPDQEEILELARSRLLNKPDDVTVRVSYPCDKS
jgi:hypothetical protein